MGPLVQYTGYAVPLPCHLSFLGFVPWVSNLSLPFLTISSQYSTLMVAMHASQPDIFSVV